MRLAFVVADARAHSPTFATIYLAMAAARRGHDVAFVGVDDLTLGSDNHVVGLCVRPARPCNTNHDLCAALAAEDAVSREESLGAFDVVFLRYNPHREAASAGNPAVEFGWRLRLGGVLVVNDPEGTQRAGGRMYLAGLPSEIRPRTLITRETARVKAFLKTLDAPAVIKPLAEHENDPASRFYVARGQVKNLNQILTVVRKTGYLVVQEYLPDAAQGEKRLLLLNGEPIRQDGKVAIYRRMVDEVEGTAAGHRGTRKRCTFGPVEQRIVDLLRPKLLSDGLYFVGVDIVGDRVQEVNVFTPGGAHASWELYGLDVGEVVVRDLERRVQVRRAYRKSLEHVA
jgi:glutathione synthase